MFSGGRERVHWEQMGYNIRLAVFKLFHVKIFLNEMLIFKSVISRLEIYYCECYNCYISPIKMFFPYCTLRLIFKESFFQYTQKSIIQHYAVALPIFMFPFASFSLLL